MDQVFISYSRKDLTFVEQLTLDLKGAGLEVWYDLSRLEGGERWRTEIQNAIKSSQYVIIVLSPDSIESVWVEREFIFSSNLKRKIIPLLYRQCELPLNYLDLNFIDVQGENYQRNFDKILKALSVAAVKLIPADNTYVKKPRYDKKTLIWAGIVITFSSVLLSLATFFLLDKANFGQAPTPTLLSEIDQKYVSLGGAEGPLGEPLESEQSTPDGIARFRNFQNGLIYWSPDTGAHEVHGDIYGKWSELGRETSPLGYPISDESGTADGIGSYNDFQGGSIFWHPDTGVHEVHGDIYGKWSELGRETSPLGYPISDESSTADGIGSYNDFQGGSIFWHPDTGAHEVHGDIFGKWSELGREAGPLGYPVSDESSTADGIGSYNDFQSGSIFWHPDTGAHAVHGDIYGKWSELGRETSCLGYPISDQEETGEEGVFQSRFEHGIIKWSSEQGAVETWE